MLQKCKYREDGKEVGDDQPRLKKLDKKETLYSMDS
jgi:hypothetical protein